MGYQDDLASLFGEEQQDQFDLEVEPMDLAVVPDEDDLSYLEGSSLVDAMPDADPYVDGIQLEEMPSHEENIGKAYIYNEDVDPAQRARSLEIQQQTQEREGYIWPVEDIEADFAYNDKAAIFQDMTDGIDWAEVPVTAGLLADPATAPIFYGDAKGIADLEKTVEAMADPKQAFPGFHQFISGYWQTRRGVLYEELLDGDRITEEEAEKFTTAHLMSRTYRPGEFGTDWDGASGAVGRFFANIPNESMLQIGQQMARMQETIESTVENYNPVGGIGERGSFAQEALYTMWRTEYANAFEEYSKEVDEMGKAYDPAMVESKAKAYATGSLVVEVVFDAATGYMAKTPLGQIATYAPKKVLKYGLKKTINELATTKAGRDTIGAMATLFTKTSLTSGGEELVQQTLQDSLRETIRATGGEVERMTLGDMAGSGLQAFKKGFQGGGVVQVVQSTPYMVMFHQQSKANEAAITSLQDAITGNLPEVSEKSPNQFHQVVQKLVDEKGASLYMGVEAESFQRYMEAVGMTDEQLAEISPVAAESLSKVRNTGGYVEIPTAQFFSTFLNADQFNETVLDDVKFHDELPTLNEAKEINAKLEEVKVNEDYDSTYQEFYDKISPVVDADVADSYTQLMTHAYLTMGKEANMTPDEMITAFGWDVVNQDQEIADIETAVIQIQNSKEPTNAEIYGMSLQEFAEAGGTVDDAVKAGYVAEDITDEQWDALKAQPAPIYKPIEHANPQLLARKEAIEALKVEAKNLGIDLNTGSPAEIREQILSRRLEQAAGWSEERTTRVIDQEDQKSMIAWVHPNDFVRATTGGPEGFAAIQEEAGDLRPEDLRSETETPILWVDEETGRITGHEGRHRMSAMFKSGVRRVPVIVRYGERGDRAAQGNLRLLGQEFETTSGTDMDLADAIPITWENKQQIRQMMGEEGRFLFQADAGPSIRISTAYPTAKNTPNTLGEVGVLEVDLDVAEEQAPKMLQINMDKIKSKTHVVKPGPAARKKGAQPKEVEIYAGFVTDKEDPREAAEDYIDYSVDNLLWLYDQVPEFIRQRSKLWYDGANTIANDWAERYDVEPSVVAAVLAALSPQKDWFQNVSLAERVLDIWHNVDPDTVISDREAAYQTYTDDKGVLQAKNKKIVDDIIDKPVGDLTDPVEVAAWIRIYDEQNNDRGYRVVSPEGDMLGEPAGKVAWGSNAEIAKAVIVLSDQSLENINASMGAGHKIRNFYNNIADPGNPRDVTIDTHAVAAMLLRPLSAKSPEVGHNFGTLQGSSKNSKIGLGGTYVLGAEAYRKAAEQRGVSAREMQSITWEAVRGLFEDTYKRTESAKALNDPQGLTDIDKIWKQYENGEITKDEARKRILRHAEGIKPPDWYGPDSQLPTEQRLSYNKGELFGDSVSRGTAGGIRRRGGVDAAGGDTRLRQDTRGYIDIAPGRNYFKITLTGKANLSTFLHESAHQFLEMMQVLSEREGASPQLSRDLDIIKQWVGWEEGQLGFTTEQHEKWARGFEAYLMSGKAPTIELQTAFQRFATWLTAIYTSIKNLGVDLNDEITGVMDRMLASEESIQMMAELRDIKPAIPNAQAGNMTDEEYQDYLTSYATAMAAAEQKMFQSLIKEQRRKNQEKYRSTKKRIKKEITNTVTNRPVYKAIRFLRTGQLDDTNDIPPALQGDKLDAAMVKQALAARKELLRKLPRNIKEKGGDLVPEKVAGHFGFRTDAEMLVAMAEAEPEAAVIKRLTDEAMDELYGDTLSDPDKLAEAATQALHNENIENFHTQELRKLSRAANRPVPTKFVEMARAFAREEIGSKTVRELRSAYKYQQAEQRAIKELMDATSRNDWAAAADAKQRQIINHLLYREAVKAKTEIDKIHNYVKKFTTLKQRQKLGLAGPEYREAMDELLESVELKKISGAAVDRRKTLRENLDYMENSTGQNVIIPDNLRDEANLQNYTEMTLDEFRGLRDAVKNIETLARNKDMIVTQQRRMERELIQDAMVAAIYETRAEKSEREMYSDSGLDKLKAKIKTHDAELLKMEFLFKQLDAQAYGIWQQFIFEPLAVAQKKAWDMKQELHESFIEPMLNMAPEQVARLRKEHVIEGVEGKVTGFNVIAIALNMGNQSNIDKMIRGQNEYLGSNWTEEWLQDRLDEILTKEDWDLVQFIWDQVDQYWDDLAGVSERTTGVKPPRIDPKQISSKHGTYKGGYYPIITDKRATAQARRRHDTADLMKSEANLMFNNVAHGFTKERTSDAKPLLFDFSQVGSHMGEVIHYITHYEAIDAVYRLTRSPRIENAFSATGGLEYYKQIKPWLQHIANNGKSPEGMKISAQIFNHMASGVSIATMGFNLSTAGVQPLGLLSTVRQTGWKNLLAGFSAWMTPQRNHAALMESNELAQSKEVIDRETAKDLGEAFRRWEKRGMLKGMLGEVTSWGWWMLVNVQQQINYITYHAAYAQAVNDMDMGDRDAIMQADSIVRTAQTAAAPKDVADIQRQDGVMRTIVAFYSYLSALYGQTREDLRQVTGSLFTGKATSGAAKVRGITNIITTLYLSAIIEKALKDGLPDDEEPPLEWYKNAAIQGTLFGMATVPLLKLPAAMISDYPFRMAPMDSMLNQGVYSVKKIVDPDKGLEDLTMKDFKNLTRMATIVSPWRAPTEIFWDMADYVNAYVDGDIENPVTELIFGERK